MSAPERTLALIGLGYWGKNILRNLVEMDVLREACDTNADLLRERQKQFPHTSFVGSIDDILGNPAIKGVVVATPAVTHVDIVKCCLLADKDVLVEKPLALTVAEGEELIALAERQRRVLMVGHILQYHPAVRQLKELIRAGELGTIQYLYSNRLNIGKLRSEENILWSFAPHDISVILSLLDQEPTKVRASGGAYINSDVADTTVTTMEFRRNIKAHIFVSWLHPFKEQKLVVVGSKAMAVFDDLSKEKLVLFRHSVERRAGSSPIAKPAEREIQALAAEEPLRNELEQFLHCIATRSTPLTNGHEGLRVLRVLAAADESLTRGL